MIFLAKRSMPRNLSYLLPSLCLRVSKEFGFYRKSCWYLQALVSSLSLASSHSVHVWTLNSAKWAPPPFRRTGKNRSRKSWTLVDSPFHIVFWNNRSYLWKKSQIPYNHGGQVSVVLDMISMWVRLSVGKRFGLCTLLLATKLLRVL